MALVEATQMLRVVQQATTNKSGSEGEPHRGRSAAHAAIAHVVLYSIAVELAIKHLWEVAHGKECKRTHDITKLFEELPPPVRKKIEQLHKSAEARYADILRQIEQHPEFPEWQGGRRVATLYETLESNKDMIRDFKYEGRLEGNTMLLIPYTPEGEDEWTVAWADPTIHDFASILNKHLPELEDLARAS